MPNPKSPDAPVTRFPKKVADVDAARPASALIDRRISELQDWRGPMLAELRRIIRSASPEIVEEWKWNTPVWSCSGIICTGETYKKAVKLTFAKGATLPDPASLFNSSLEGHTRRAIDYAEDGSINAQALAALVQAAVAMNKAGAKRKRTSAS